MILTFWLTLARGIFALVIGALMLRESGKTPEMLLNFMGMFWLASGFVSLRWGLLDYQRRKMALAAGVVAIFAGLSLLTRKLTLPLLQEYTFLIMLGIVILLTGLLHLFGGFKTSAKDSEHQALPSLLLGIFEILLGLLLLIRPLERGPLVYYSACIWAFICGFLLISDALAMRRARLKMAAETQQPARA